MVRAATVAPVVVRRVIPVHAVAYTNGIIASMAEHMMILVILFIIVPPFH